MEGNVLYALLLTVFAGAATGIGSAIAFFAKKTNTKFLSFALGLSTGVMIYVSFMEMLYEARNSLTVIMDSDMKGNLVTVAAFFSGILLAGIIDRLIPAAENPHELHSVEEMGGKVNPDHLHKLKRMGIVTAIAIAVHNFPEGIATFISGFAEPQVGIAVAALSHAERSS